MVDYGTVYRDNEQIRLAIQKNKIKWDLRYLSVCNTISKFSSCHSRQIGTVLVRDNSIISTGYNGPPRGVKHCTHKGKDCCPRQALGYQSGKGLHLCPAVHAEANSIVNAARMGVRTMGTTLYMNCGLPCKDCFKEIINSGIKQIVCFSGEYYDELSKKLYNESLIIVRHYNVNESEVKGL